VTTKSAKSYSVGEEIAHSITHGIGALASVAGLAVLVALATLRGDAWHVVACSIYGASLFMLFTASTLYHSIPLPRAKAVLRTIDHAAIYLLIAGTYTPFALVSLRGGWGWTLFGVAWGLAVVGIVWEIMPRRRFKAGAVALYLVMGWMALTAIEPLIAAVEPGGVLLLSLGGLMYTVGVLFYLWHRLPHHHTIWHLFVLAGSAFHFFAVLYYVIP
jgi:hemolysin III